MTAGAPFTTLRPVPVRAAQGAMDLLVAVGGFAAANALAGWGWSRAELGILAAGWAAVRGLAIGWELRRGRALPAVEVAAGSLVLVAVGVLRSAGAGSFAQLLYGLVFTVLAQAGWRSWQSRNEAARNRPVTEPLRVLLVAAAGCWVLSPMFTDRSTGGIDARWYAFMLHDFIEQWRTHGPPVFLGQGGLVWVGSVHPFRSAPVYMHLAGLWDWVTFQSLGAVALQHLTAITAVLAGGWGVYASGVKLAPGARWGAAGIAALYAMSPAVLMTLYIADAYMTYLAAAVFVWVFYANARVLTDGRGWASLAASLSLAWMCHPPTAMQVTLLSAVLQMGGMAGGPLTWTEWRKAFAAGVLFGLLSLYYFAGMRELPASEGMELKTGLLQMMALPLGWYAGARVLLLRRTGWWLLVVVPVAVVLWFTCQPWLAWLGLTLVLVGLVAFVLRRWGGFDPAGHAPLILLLCVLAGAAGMDWALREGGMAAGSYTERSRELWGDTWADNYFKPLSRTLQSEGDYQPGWGLWLAGAAAGVAACRRGARAVQFVFAALVLMLPLLVHWPRVGDFMLEHVPWDVTSMTGLSMELRVMPVFTALLVFGGLLALREIPKDAVGVRRLAGLGLLLAVGWAAWQGRYFVQRGQVITATPAQTAKDWRSENASMDRFVYDLLPIPSYFSHGKMDPRLEVRLLDDRGNLIYGPAQMVAAMESAGSETIRLEPRLLPGNPDWVEMKQAITLAPGEHRLLRFDFDPASRYVGYLFLISDHGYREYLLPESGMTRSFGTGPAHSRVVSLWNSGTETERYLMQYKRLPGHDRPLEQEFATLTQSVFRPELALIQVESLNPWRVRTRLPWSGQLETPRVFLPGYEVKVDGRRLGPSRVSVSPDRLLQIAMPPGEHTVEVRYVGTVQLRLAGVVSLVAWVLALGLWCLPERSRVAAWFWTLSARVGLTSTGR